MEDSLPAGCPHESTLIGAVWPLCPDDAEGWFSDAYQGLRDGVKTHDRFGRIFVEIFRTWIITEAKFRFQNPSRGFAKAKRPAELNKWIGNGRWRTTHRLTQSSKTFGTELMAWWATLTPATDITADSSCEEIRASGDWKRARAPGNNGFLSVVMGLKWWGGQIRDGDEEEWARFDKFARKVIVGMEIIAKIEGEEE
ncbi:hypothetical protein DL96DRAFT_1475715 [Flagelloscypha sp. PMI_526]|nr:hypothetical protein DL96DRAFT_1475715 [Flagelloscypha sp. PMI_526]